LLTPHPEASRSWMNDPAACRKYVEAARERLRKRVAEETSAP
jgi:hypothetical protein